jgi:hypothetical protein
LDATDPVPDTSSRNQRKRRPANRRREAFLPIPMAAEGSAGQVRLPMGFVEGAFTSFPAEMHEVHTLTLRLSPDSS